MLSITFFSLGLAIGMAIGITRRRHFYLQQTAIYAAILAEEKEQTSLLKETTKLVATISSAPTEIEPSEAWKS